MYAKTKNYTGMSITPAIKDSTAAFDCRRNGISVIVLSFCILATIFPKECIYAAKDGLLLWFNNVLPSLLPFIVGINLLIALGFLDSMGKLFSPVMKPLFGVSGTGGFALAAGMMSGYPMGAKIVSTLRRENRISKIEAQRLIGFANNSGPLFIIGAVGIGMFGSQTIGYFLLSTHYLSAIINGMLHRFYKPLTTPAFEINQRPLSKPDTGSPISALFSESVKNAMETILIIGGFIIIFCVISKLLQVTGIILYMARLLIGAARLIGLDENSLSGFLIGIIEVTNGSNIIAASAIGHPALLAVSAVTAFGGFSIHAQTASFIKETDISFGGYILSKISHAVISVFVGHFLLPFFNL